MKEGEVRELARLDPRKLDPREYAALRWVQETLTCMEGACEETTENFKQAFDERERMYVIATMKGMYFFNLAGNTSVYLLRRALGLKEEQPVSCELNWD
jgi:hypothetical protein